MKKYLGIEFGSTRIKAVTINEEKNPLESGAFNWKSRLDKGFWTYDLSDVKGGLIQALGKIKDRSGIAAMGVSAMMHGYLAFDREWNLLTPFRTWQNTTTSEAADELSCLFAFNIPQRWSIAHLYQAILNGEEHVKDIAHITTLAGYVHHELTGENVLGIGDASGMFPVNSETLSYDERMLNLFEKKIAERNLPWKIRELLPKIALAGEEAGKLTEHGAAFLDGLLPAGIPFAPPEGDAGTGMVATNSVAPRTGNVSAGTSIFSMVVLEKPLDSYFPEIDIVSTPSGEDVAMVHCNNCTGDMNAWVGIFEELLQLFDTEVEEKRFFRALYEKSLEGKADCGGVTVINYLAGEGVTHLDEGVPLVVRNPGEKFSLADFLRSQLYSTMATLKIGMDLLAREGVKIDTLTGHGGLFKVPGVGQKYMASACKAPVTVMETAGEGGPYGMALLSAFLKEKEDGETLERYLAEKIFADARSVTLAPDEETSLGFNRYLDRFRKALKIEESAIENK